MHQFHKHRDSQRDAGHERYKAHGGKTRGKPIHVSKHVHVNIGSLGPDGGTPPPLGTPGGLPAPGGPLAAGAGPVPGMPVPGGPPPVGMPGMPPGMPPQKRGGRT